MPDTRFMRMETEVVASEITKNEEFMGLLRTLAINLVSDVTQGKLPQPLLDYALTDIMEGNSDNVSPMKGLISGSIALLQHFPVFADMFDFCAKVPSDQTTVKRVAERTKKIAEADKEAVMRDYRDQGFKVIEIPGLGFITEIPLDSNNQDDVFKTLLDKIFGGSDTKRPH